MFTINAQLIRCDVDAIRKGYIKFPLKPLTYEEETSIFRNQWK